MSSEGDFVIERARPADRAAILEVMRPANMHHVPSDEMPELDLDRFFVARRDGVVIGAAGYAILGEGRGKTTLLSVLPEARGAGVGGALQDARLLEMQRLGVRRVVTNADREPTIAWYRERYGYEVIGSLEKVHEFGHPDVDRWTTLELDLAGWTGPTDQSPGWSVGAAPPRARLHRRAVLTAQALGYAIRELSASRRSVTGFERAQARRVRRMVRHAHDNVPFYREAMRREGIDPREIRTAADLRRLPIVGRSELQADPERFMDRTRRREECVMFRTGGSSGHPVSVTHSLRDVVEKNSAVWRLRSVLHELGAPRVGRRVARLEPPMSSGEKLALAADRNNLLSRIDPRQTEVRLPAHADPVTLIEALNRFGPDVIGGYGSALQELFAESVARDLPIDPPRAVVYGADAMSEAARNLLREELGIPVLSSYQAVETPMIAFECDAGRGMHANTDLCAIRVVGLDGRDLGPGKQGEVVVSNLLARTTVLLNYRLGDIAEWIGEPCECGRALPLLSLVRGRAGIHFTDPSGRRIPSQYVERAFSSLKGVLGYRLAQESAERIEGQVLARPGADSQALEREIGERYRSLVGLMPRLEVRFVNRLPRTPAGKVSHSTVIHREG